MKDYINGVPELTRRLTNIVQELGSKGTDLTADDLERIFETLKSASDHANHLADMRRLMK